MGSVQQGQNAQALTHVEASLYPNPENSTFIVVRNGSARCVDFDAKFGQIVRSSWNAGTRNPMR